MRTLCDSSPTYSLGEPPDNLVASPNVIPSYDAYVRVNLKNTIQQ